MTNNRRPTHPGVCFRKEVMADEIDWFYLSETTGIEQHRLLAILYGVVPVTAETAIKLAAYSETSPESWYMMQVKRDMYDFAAASEDKQCNP